MKQTTRTSRTAGYLEKIFRELNQDFFAGEIEEPVITIQNTPGAYGHVTVLKTWIVGDQEKHELNIGSGTLARPIEYVVTTMLHEMVHLYHLKNNIQDCSRGNTYHNKKFRDKAVEIGLIVNHSDKYGWAHTEPSDKILEYVLDKNWTEIQMNDGHCNFGSFFGGTQIGKTPTGTATGTGTQKPTTTKSNSRKYVCPKCGMIVRATKIVNVKCGDCDETMIENWGAQTHFENQ